MEDKLYIVFAEKTGKDDDGNHFYRLLFSDNPDVVWGDNFNVTPAGVIPDLEPDSSSISKEFSLTVKQDLGTAVESTWFSFQDCIDGIISLLFDGKSEQIVNIPFGMEFGDVKSCVDGIGGVMSETRYKGSVENGEES